MSKKKVTKQKGHPGAGVRCEFYCFLLTGFDSHGPDHPLNLGFHLVHAQQNRARFPWLALILFFKNIKIHTPAHGDAALVQTVSEKMKTRDFDYHLPKELIAQFPTQARTGSRLLVLDRQAQSLVDKQFSDVIDFLQPGDLLVMNNTRVIPARLYGVKETGGKVEVLIERVLNEHEVLAQVRASKSPKQHALLLFDEDIKAQVVGREGEFFHLRFVSDRSALDVLNNIGHMPLPPYIERADENTDLERYQTVYSDVPGAVAAPTAGLHFDRALLDKIENKGVDIAYLTLHVGAGTFQPVRVDDIERHVMHHEWIDVPQAVVDRIRQTKVAGKRVIAIGTTTVRSLETAALSGTLKPFCGDTNIFITPGFEFKVVDALITNFHLPQSTLLMLVSAFAGHAFVFEAYRHAVKQEYRFFSYGDAMLIY